MTTTSSTDPADEVCSDEYIQNLNSDIESLERDIFLLESERQPNYHCQKAVINCQNNHLKPPDQCNADAKACNDAVIATNQEIENQIATKQAEIDSLESQIEECNTEKNFILE